MERRKPNFGNAGAVNNLLATAALRMEARTKHLPVVQRATSGKPLAVDFCPEEAGSVDPAAIFKDLVGCKAVLDKLKDYQATITASQKLGRDPLAAFELNFLFVGSPGTGKTTVARRVGMLFKSLGLLAEDEVIECSAKDFTTQYAGQASFKTREMFEKGLGKVLFIDEAYRLNPKDGNPFVAEALNEIVQILTEPRFLNKMVVVMAGYEAQLDELMSANPGLKSRFSEKLRFPDFGCADACKLFEAHVQKTGLEMSEETRTGLTPLMDELIAAPGWSNGRDLGTWFKRVFQQYSRRISEQTGPSTPQASQGCITMPDLRLSLNDFLASKTVAPKPPNPRDLLFPPTPPSQSLTQPPPPAPTTAQAAPATTQAPPLLAHSPPAMATPQPAAVSVAPPVEAAVDRSVAVSTPAAPVAEDSEEWVDIATPPKKSGSFGGLSSQFLAGVQSSLEDLGYDLTSADIMQRLVGDTNLPETLLASLASVIGGVAGSVLREMVRQWQQALPERCMCARTSWCSGS
ncbi:MAG: hypothetical protein WDW38_007194 [Sanguina aurantia]